MRRKSYLFESEMRLSKDERRAFLESMKKFSQYKNEIYRSKRLKEIASELGQLIESAEAFTLQEAGEDFDKISLNKDLKEIKTDYKLFEKTCHELHGLQQRLEAVYENIGIKLGRYYDL